MTRPLDLNDGRRRNLPPRLWLAAGVGAVAAVVVGGLTLLLIVPPWAAEPGNRGRLGHTLPRRGVTAAVR
jgi:hypothetical protein